MTMQFRKVNGQKPSGEPLRYTACGLENVYLVNGFTRETIDGEEYLTIEDLDGLWKAIGLNLVSTQKTLAPKEIRFLRDHMKLTQAELGGRLRVSDQTVARWEKGETQVPGPADLMLRVLFLASEAAQPQGNEILRKFFELCGSIIEHDEPLPRPAVMFRHISVDRIWKQSAGELVVAVC